MFLLKVQFVNQWGAISCRWQYWDKHLDHIYSKKFPSHQNNLAYHPGPVTPPSGDGSPFCKKLFLKNKQKEAGVGPYLKNTGKRNPKRRKTSKYSLYAAVFRVG